MKLIRIALARFEPNLDSQISVAMEEERISLRTRWARDATGAATLVLFAETRLEELPSVDAERKISIPDAALRAAETLIEKVANLLAVNNQRGRALSSPHPCAYLVAENDDEERWLTGIDSVRADPTGSGSPRGGLGETTADLSGSIADRWDGVALLAEALSHTHATGELHELIRVFERAFRSGPGALIEPLARFLEGSPFGYSQAEVARWIDLRHPATHADRRDDFVLEGDVRPVISRMEQAAYDVLFNKAHWRNPDAERRDVWRATVGTSDDQGGIFLTAGAPASLQFSVVDEFGRYPLNLHAVLGPHLPAAWWWKSARSGSADREPSQAPIQSGSQAG